MSELETPNQQPQPPAAEPAPESFAPQAPIQQSAQPDYVPFAQMRPPAPPSRVPNFGHFAILCTLSVAGFVVAMGAFFIALHFKAWGQSDVAKAAMDVHYSLGFQGLWYAISFAPAIFIMPLFWNRSFLQGVGWNAPRAARLAKILLPTAAGCFILSQLAGLISKEPKDAPILDMLKTTEAAWWMAIFGTLVAPLAEELFFRGFLLPALCTAFDWTGEKFFQYRRLAPNADGGPQWTMGAMIFGTLLASAPFMLIHGPQIGWTIGALAAIFLVSVILCAVRLKTRSVAASTLVHCTYNFMIFAVMFVSTSGFRHLDQLK